MRETPYAQEKERLVRDLLRKRLAQHKGNRTHTARALGLDRAYLQRLIRKFGLQASDP